MKVLLGISMVMNLILAVCFFVDRKDHAVLDSWVESGTKSSSSNSTYGEQFSDGRYAPFVTLAEIQQKYATPFVAPATYYWEPNNKVISELQDERKRNFGLIRHELVSVYGEDAINESVFAAYFYPLGPGFEFLTSEQHIAVSELRDSYRATLTPVSGGLKSFSEFQNRESKYLSEVRALMDDREFLEFQLRESQLAQQMKNSGFDWTESEFREVYSIRSRSGDDATSSNGLSRLSMSATLYDENIKTALGEARYLDYLKRNDSTFKRIESQVLSGGGSETDAENAYRVHVDYSQQISEAMRDRDLRLAQQLQKERDSQIQDSIGITINRSTQIPLSLSEGSPFRIQ